MKVSIFKVILFFSIFIVINCISESVNVKEDEKPKANEVLTAASTKTEQQPPVVSSTIDGISIDSLWTYLDFDMGNQVYAFSKNNNYFTMYSRLNHEIHIYQLKTINLIKTLKTYYTVDEIKSIYPEYKGYEANLFFPGFDNGEKVYLGLPSAQGCYFSSDSRYFIYTIGRESNPDKNSTGGVLFFSLETGRLERVIKIKGDSVILSQDLSLIISSDFQKNTIEIINLETKKSIAKIDNIYSINHLWDLLISSDNKYIYTVSKSKKYTANPENTVKIWDISGKKIYKTFEKKQTTPVSIALSGDNNLVFMGMYDGTVEVYNTLSGKHLETIQPKRIFKAKEMPYRVMHTQPVLKLYSSFEGDYILSVSQNRIILWDILKKQPLLCYYGNWFGAGLNNEPELFYIIGMAGTRILDLKPFIEYAHTSENELWTKYELQKADTARGEDYLTEAEKDVILLVNLARLNSRKFLNILFKDYIKKSRYKEEDEYVQSLIWDLLHQPLNIGVLKPDKDIYYAARDHAQDMGKTGKIGHISSDGGLLPGRIRKYKKSFSERCAENCDYGNSQPMDIFLSLLVDKDVPSLGHRENILSSDYKYIGVSMQPHSYYGINTVMDFSE